MLTSGLPRYIQNTASFNPVFLVIWADTFGCVWHVVLFDYTIILIRSSALKQAKHNDYYQLRPNIWICSDKNPRNPSNHESKRVHFEGECHVPRRDLECQ